MQFERLLIGLALVASLPGAVAAVQSDSTVVRTDSAVAVPQTTAAGVYTREQARAGEDLYAGICTGCHTVSSHIGLDFQKSWLGMPVSELMIYLQEYMPEDAPGMLTAEEYIQVIAYLFQVNDMPAGETALPADLDVLRGIRIDTVATDTSSSPPGGF
jgi:mono/diheme cytochrome c family protein